MAFHRKMEFARTWYPSTAAECESQILEFAAPGHGAERAPPGVMGIVPHAGWMYSGRLASQVFDRLAPAGIDLVIVLGGHLDRNDPMVAMVEGDWVTPFGEFPIHQGFTSRLKDFSKVVLETEAKHFPDNSIELQLPFARRRYPDAELLPIRVPPNDTAVELGRALAAYLRGRGHRWVLVASTDLTHYGPAYGFEPQGGAPDSVAWMTRNDQTFIDAVATASPRKILDAAQSMRNACSAGAVAALCACAGGADLRFDLLDYTSSAETPPHATKNMVGYMGAVFV